MDAVNSGGRRSSLAPLWCGPACAGLVITVPGSPLGIGAGDPSSVTSHVTTTTITFSSTAARP